MRFARGKEGAADRRPRACPRGNRRSLDLTGRGRQLLVGLAILHSLFMREHNAICDRLAAEYPQMSDQELYDKARLVNAALMAKIHTVDWTPAIIAHPTTVFALRAELVRRPRRAIPPAVRTHYRQRGSCGIPGSPTNHHGVPYSLTEEFVAVYRMHPLIPDDYVFRSVRTTSWPAMQLPDLTADKVRERLNEMSMADIFYSFGAVESRGHHAAQLPAASAAIPQARR